MGNIPEEVLLALAAKNSGGGSGGTSNYEDLENKPKINGETLSGNKSASDLGLATADDVQGILDGQSIDSFSDVENIVGNAEATNAASKAYSVDSFLVLNGILYRVTEAIENGGTIYTTGNNQNVVATSITEEMEFVEIEYDDWMELTEEERETGNWFVYNWPQSSPTGFNLPMLCSYGSSSGIGGVSAKYNYWFGILASSSHTIPAISAGSNCKVTKVVDHKENTEDAFGLYAIEKTNKNSSATISEAHTDSRSLFGISEFYDLGEFTKSNGNESVLTVSTDKPLLLCSQSGLSGSLYPVIDTMNKGEAFLITRCQYGNYDNGEMYVLIPEDGEIDLTFTHGTIYAYAEINN